MSQALEFHPLSNIFPFMSNSEFSELVIDVEKNGVLEPVWLFDGQIIDGRHRFKATQKIGIECPTRDYLGVDPVAFILSLNLNRRHLNESQRGMVAANLANMPAGRPNLTARIQAVNQTQAADKLNVSRDTVQKAVKINAASPGLASEVISGNVSINAAAKIAKLPIADQEIIIAAGAEAIKDAARFAKPIIVISDEITELRDRLEEIAADLKSTLADNEMMGRVFDSDDRIKSAMDEAKRQKAIADNAERTLAAKNGEYVARAAQVTHWQNRAIKAEKELAKLKATV